MKKPHEETWEEVDSGQILCDGNPIAEFYMRVPGEDVAEARGRLAAQAPEMARLLLRLASTDELAEQRPVDTLERDALDVLRAAGVIP